MFTEQELAHIFGVRTPAEVKRYPLTDISMDKNKVVYIELAVAGFSKEDIDLEIKGNKLHIKGTNSREELDLEYVQRHISNQDFERVIALDDKYLSGKFDAELNDGILTIMIEPVEPEKIKISLK